MKKAVILSNHYRSFEYIASYLKDFFGKDTDFYICTWDHEYNYENQAIKEKYAFEKKQDVQLSPLMYKPIDIKKIQNFIREFNPKDYKILTDEEFDTWAEKMPNVPKTSKYHSRQILGSFLPPKICADMIRNSGIEYDLIFKSRMDIIPIMSEGYNFDSFCATLLNLQNHKPRTILSTSLKINSGLPWINDRFLSGHADAILDLYDNLEYKINTLFSLKFLHKETPLLFHRLYGMLLTFTKINVRATKVIYDEIIRKDFVDMNLKLGNIEDHEKALELKRKIKGNIEEKSKINFDL